MANYLCRLNMWWRKGNWYSWSRFLQAQGTIDSWNPRSFAPFKPLTYALNLVCIQLHTTINDVLSRRKGQLNSPERLPFMETQFTEPISDDIDYDSDFSSTNPLPHSLSLATFTFLILTLEYKIFSLDFLLPFEHRDVVSHQWILMSKKLFGSTHIYTHFTSKSLFHTRKLLEWK